MRPVPDQVVMVTGATDGLGRQVAQGLAGRGATVLLHGRNPERAGRTVAELVERTGNDRVRYHLADFSSLAQVARLADEVTATNHRLDVLVNNAGIGSGAGRGRREVSADGHELRFAVNYLAGFLLTRRLLPLLRAAAPARIVNVTSVAQQRIDFDDLMLERRYRGQHSYARSKLAQVLFTVELAQRLRGTGVTVNAVHPASLMNTKMVHEAYGYWLNTVNIGATSVEALMLDPDLARVSGRYFNEMTEARANAQAYDPVARTRLWELSERLTADWGGEP